MFLEYRFCDLLILCYFFYLLGEKKIEKRICLQDGDLERVLYDVGETNCGFHKVWS